MTMLGKKDGANATDGSSYLEIVSFLKANGAKPRDDVQELWKRIVFSMAVSNTDDHLEIMDLYYQMTDGNFHHCMM